MQVWPCRQNLFAWVLKMKVNHDILCVVYSIRFSCMVVCCCSVSLCCTTLSWLCTSTSKETKTLSGKIAYLTHQPLLPMFPSLFVEACCVYQVLVILFLYLKALGGFVSGLHRDFPQVNDNPCSKQGESVYFCDSSSSTTDAILNKQHNNNNNKFKWLRVFSIAANWEHNKGNISVRINIKYIYRNCEKMYPANVYVTRLTTIWNSSI